MRTPFVQQTNVHYTPSHTQSPAVEHLGIGNQPPANNNNNNNNGTNGNTGNAHVVAITSTHYDKRGLLSRDPDAFTLSLRSLSYLTLANTHVVAQLMLADGGVSLLVRILNHLINSPVSSSGLHKHSTSSNHYSTQSTSSQMAPFAFSALDHDDRVALATHALSACTNLMVRGRSKVRDALVEAGLVSVLVEFLGPIVAAIEALQEISNSTIPPQSLQPVQPVQLPVQPPPVSSTAGLGIASDALDAMEVDSTSGSASLDSLPSVANTSNNTSAAEVSTPPAVGPDAEPQQPTMSMLNSNSGASTSGLSMPHAPSAAEPSHDHVVVTPGPEPTDGPQQEQQPQLPAHQLSFANRLRQLPQQPPQQQQANVNAVQPLPPILPLPAAPVATAPAAPVQQQAAQASRHQEAPLLPGVRHITQTYETTQLLTKIVPHQHHILMACKVLHMISKYPHLRHYMHVDSTRPVRPKMRDLCAAAIAAADSQNGGVGEAVEGDEKTIASVLSGLPARSATPSSGLAMELEGRITARLFDAGVTPMPLSVTPTPVIATAASATMLTASSAAVGVAPVVTSIPMLAFEHEDPEELALLEELCCTTPPSAVFPPALAPAASSLIGAAATPGQRTHVIQTTLHYHPEPKNARSAFELLEVFTSPCNLIPDARTLAVSALRNAYRRDPVPGPADPPHAPLNQAMGPCLYVDVAEFAEGRVSGWKGGKGAVVVGLGHLRRCASSRCGKWEEGYKQFSKCSRCRRVSYCSKTCQRKAWVLHKNWCLKYTGDTVPTGNAPQSVTSTVANSAEESSMVAAASMRRRASSAGDAITGEQ